jgi:hypothetical protein
MRIVKITKGDHTAWGYISISCMYSKNSDGIYLLQYTPYFFLFPKSITFYMGTKKPRFRNLIALDLILLLPSLMTTIILIILLGIHSYWRGQKQFFERIFDFSHNFRIGDEFYGFINGVIVIFLITKIVMGWAINFLN